MERLLNVMVILIIVFMPSLSPASEYQLQEMPASGTSNVTGVVDVRSRTSPGEYKID